MNACTTVQCQREMRAGDFYPIEHDVIADSQRLKLHWDESSQSLARLQAKTVDLLWQSFIAYFPGVAQ